MTAKSPTTLPLALHVERECRLALLRIELCIAQAAKSALHRLVRDPEVLEDAELSVRYAEMLLEQEEASIEIEAFLRRRSAYRRTHTWLDLAREQYPAGSGMDAAANAVRDYICASREAEYWYDCNSNPDGIDESVLREGQEDARHMMHALLAELDESTANSILSAIRDVDHDGSSFHVTDWATVLEWKLEQGNRSIDGAALILD